MFSKANSLLQVIIIITIDSLETFIQTFIFGKRTTNNVKNALKPLFPGANLRLKRHLSTEHMNDFTHNRDCPFYALTSKMPYFKAIGFCPQYHDLSFC